MPERFQIGQRVKVLRRTPYLRRPADGPFVVVECLHGDGPFGVYRVRQESGTSECVVAEEDLEALPEGLPVSPSVTG